MSRSGNSRYLSRLALFGKGRQEALLLFLSSAVINILGLAVPITLMQVYDRILPYRALGSLLWLGFACTTAVILDAILRYARDRLVSWLGGLFEHIIATSGFRALLSSTSPQVESDQDAVHLERFHHISTLRSNYCNQFIQIIFDIPFGVLYAGTVWWLNKRMGLFVVAICAVAILIVAIVKPFYSRARNRFEKFDHAKQEALLEAAGNISIVKSFALEEQIMRRYEELYVQKNMAAQDMNFLSATPGGVSALLSQVAIFGSIATGASSVVSGHMTLGTLTACMMLAGRVIQPLQSALKYWLSMGSIVDARRDVEDLLDFSTKSLAPLVPPRSQDQDIVFKNVSVSYDGKNRVFKDLSCTITAKKCFAITNSQSNVASAFLQIAAGLLAPTEGVVTGAGTIGKERGTSLIERDPKLFSGSILENISSFNPVHEAKAMTVASSLHLDRFVSSLAQGYNTQVKREANFSLPKSLRQMLCVSRALVNNPSILILDRADASLDIEATRIFVNMIKDLKGKSTIIMATDNQQLLSLCDEIYKITDDKGLVSVKSSDIGSGDIEHLLFGV